MLLVCPCAAQAQSVPDGNGAETYSFQFSGESLTEALEKIARETHTDLVFDPGLVRGITVYQRISDQTVTGALKALLESEKLDYLTLSSGTMVIVKSVQGEPGYGALTGKITDRRSGEPLPGATVMLADASGGTSTNAYGTFTIPRILSGSYAIIFSYIGYEPVYKIIEIQPGNELREQISLVPKPVDITPIVVEAHRPQMPRHTEENPIRADTDWQPAGVIKDPIRNLNLLPGIQYGLPVSDLHLQGGQKGEHRILLDGVPVYNPYSFGQMFSSFSPFAIGDIHLYKAGYSAREGSQIAGLVGLSHDLPDAGTKSATLQADPLSVNVRGDLHFPAGRESSIAVMSAFRSNFWNIYKDPNIERTLKDWDMIDPLITNAVADLDNDASRYSPAEQESDVEFFDFHLAGRYEIDPYQSLNTSLYMAENTIGNQVLNQAPSGSDIPRYLFASDQHSWQNFMGQISWNNMISPRLDLSARASYSANVLSHENSIGTDHTSPILAERYLSVGLSAFDGYSNSRKRLPTQIDGNRIEHAILRTDASYTLSRNFKIESGVQVDRISSDVSIDDLVFQSARAEETSTLFSTYLQGKKRIGKLLNLTLGSRLTALSPSGRFFAEPRFSIQYDQPKSKLGYWSARLSGGLYRQFINEHQITNIGPTSLVPSFTVWSHAGDSEIPRAYHVNGSFMVSPSEYTTLNFETFYKWQPVTAITSYGNLLVQENIDRSEINAFAEFTEMKAFGIGTRLRQSLAGSRLKLIAGYDYSFTQIDYESQFGRKLPAPWNEPHRAQFRFLWNIIPDLTVMAKWQGIWGRAWGFRESYYNYLRFRDEGIPPVFWFDHPENDRLSPFYQVDLSFFYRPSVGVSDLEFRLDLVNLLNRKNTLDWFLQPADGNPGTPAQQYEIRERNMPGFYPAVSLQIKF